MVKVAEIWRYPVKSMGGESLTRADVGAATLGAWDVRRFRPNLLVAGGDEDSWIGSAITVGTTRLDVVKPIDRCVVTTRPQPGGIDRDLDVLRTVNRDRAGNLGVGAMVTGGGAIAVGDEITLA